MKRIFLLIIIVSSFGFEADLHACSLKEMLSDEQASVPPNPFLARAIGAAGGIRRLADLIQFSPSVVKAWLNDHKAPIVNSFEREVKITLANQQFKSLIGTSLGQILEITRKSRAQLGLPAQYYPEEGGFPIKNPGRIPKGKGKTKSPQKDSHSVVEIEDIHEPSVRQTHSSKDYQLESTLMLTARVSRWQNIRADEVERALETHPFVLTASERRKLAQAYGLDSSSQPLTPQEMIRVFRLSGTEVLDRLITSYLIRIGIRQ